MSLIRDKIVDENQYTTSINIIDLIRKVSDLKQDEIVKRVVKLLDD